MPVMDLSAKTILTTGASSGIGRAVCIEAAKAGARIIACGRDEERLKQVVAELPGDGHCISTCDFSAVESVSDWVARLKNEFDAIDALIHCAGAHSLRPLAFAELDDARRLFDVNFFATFVLLRDAIRLKLLRRGSSVVLLSSAVADFGQPGAALYAATKGAMQSLARCMALEYSSKSIRVNVVAPGIVETEMTERIRKHWTADQEQAVRHAHPLGFGQADDVARAALFLASEASRWTTGTILRVDGGYSAQ
jgi:NAD(P)-dependent dehydrogenase (short-subunit alcohol dehydrogenase family)